MLAFDALVTMTMRRGAYVTEVNAKDLRDVFHLMAVLEADATGTVARTATAAQLLELEALHQQLEKAARDRKDHLRFFQLNEAVHVKLLEVANNRWAGQMVADLRKVMKLNRAVATQGGADRRVIGRACGHHGGVNEPGYHGCSDGDADAY